MNDDKEQIEKLKRTLDEAMRRVPIAVVNGSYQQAVQYKADYAKAVKILNKKPRRSTNWDGLLPL
jgi:hypothetical protein